MHPEYKQALEYVEKGLLNKQTFEINEDVELFCYTADCFFGEDTWDDITKKHRGRVYYKGQPVNKPFDKIFNLGEMPETEVNRIKKRMETEPYDVYDKANGHLFILSIFDTGDGQIGVIPHTKGSFGHDKNELLENDIYKFFAKYQSYMVSIARTFRNMTFMFEAIVDHDRHTLFENQKERYEIDENDFVLLGAYTKKDVPPENKKSEYDDLIYGWTPIDRTILESMAQKMGCPIVEKYENMGNDPISWRDHKDTEGYVIHFLNDDTRCKIKTKEYWALRFKKDLTPNRLLSMYRAGGHDRMHLKLPEEIAEGAMDIIVNEHKMWYMHIFVDIGSIDSYLFSKAKKKDLKDSELSSLFSESVTPTEKAQAHFLANLNSENPTPIETTLMRSRDLRRGFYSSMMHKDNSVFLERMEDKLNDLVESIV